MNKELMDMIVEVAKTGGDSAVKIVVLIQDTVVYLSALLHFLEAQP